MIENKEPKILIARAIVAPQNGLVPLCVLNLESQPVTIYKGTKVAKAKAIDLTREISTVSKQTTCTEKEWEEVLNNIMQNMPTDLNQDQLQQLSALLTHYAHIFAINSDDLGHTNIISHKIEICGGPIRPPVRQVPLPQRDEIKRLLA